jgi:hypothetical protein
MRSAWKAARSSTAGSAEEPAAAARDSAERKATAPDREGEAVQPSEDAAGAVIAGAAAPGTTEVEGIHKT